jgi:hypothetical protein
MLKSHVNLPTVIKLAVLPNSILRKWGKVGLFPVFLVNATSRHDIYDEHS